MRNSHYVHVLVMAGAALFLLTAPSMAMEKEHGPGGSERGMKHDKSFWKEEENSLGLNDEQRAKMKTIREEFKTRQDVLRNEIKARHEALRQELDAVDPDRGKAEGIVKEISALGQQMSLKRVDMVLTIREILTPEQYKKLRAFHEKKRAEMKERREQMNKYEGVRE
jgi:Spy/CpxP family protein refolding chaperone